jgi:hypothetical protein
MSDDTYNYAEPVSFMSRLLWYCAGADAQLLRRCPYSDRVKFQGLGGVVLATGVLALISGSCAFYTVFAPRNDTVLATAQRAVHWPSVAISLLFGAIWGLIIFNVDRFIVSSTGKGDGTDAITLGELGRAIPRIVMAIVIGICLSAPLEIRVLQSEIEARLELEQKDYQSELDRRDAALVESRRVALVQKVEAAERVLDQRAAYFEQRRREILDQHKQLELEAEGRTASGKAGRGPAWQDKRDTLEKLEQELERDGALDKRRSTLIEADVRGWKSELDMLDLQLAAKKQSNAQAARHLDGLLKRIHISHEIGGHVPFWIAAMLLCVELGPIFFKMMLVKGAYDYLDDNQKQLVAARAGVATDVRVESGNRLIVREVSYPAERIRAEAKRRHDTENALAELVHSEYRTATAEDIRRNLERYLEPAPAPEEGVARAPQPTAPDAGVAQQPPGRGSTAPERDR